MRTRGLCLEPPQEQGQEASRPALLWLLRDFVLDLRDSRDQPISSDQYLEQDLRVAECRGTLVVVRWGCRS